MYDFQVNLPTLHVELPHRDTDCVDLIANFFISHGIHERFKFVNLQIQFCPYFIMTFHFGMVKQRAYDSLGTWLILLEYKTIAASSEAEPVIISARNSRKKTPGG